MRTLDLSDAWGAAARTAHRGFPVGGSRCVEVMVDLGWYEA